MPAPIILASGGAAQTVTVTAESLSGFSGAVGLSISGLPTGVAASPSALTVKAGQSAEVAFSASSAAAGGSTTVTITGNSGNRSQTVTAILTVLPLTTATLSGTSYDFGVDLVGSTITKQVVTVSNTGAAALHLNPSLAGDASYGIVSDGSCGSTLAAGTSCSISVRYAPTIASGSTPQTAVLNLGFENTAVATAQAVAIQGDSAILAAGNVTSTMNPQVALYTVTLPYPGSVSVNFGTTTGYGRQTWTKSIAAAGTVSVLVAGMLPSTIYHLQAVVSLANGSTSTDVDHTFTTGVPEVQPTVTTETTSGLTPQPGLEQLTLLDGTTFGLAVTDLQGNILWSYALPGDTGGYEIEGAKLMSNGNFLVTIGEGSGYPLEEIPTPDGTIVAIREIDLAGDIVQELTAADLTQRLQNAGYDLLLEQFHHDVTPLANGHWLVLSNTLKSFTDLTGYPGVTQVLGDVVIDLDQNLQPVWVWNEFDHLDVNRHPMSFPDWTHTNAIVYSPTDGNLLVSMRHQNWVVKVDYENGAGAGGILWHLGEGGDFTLLNGTDPTDWAYAQHYPSFFTANSAGVFSLGLMDNGNDRAFPTGVVCGTTGAPACEYTTIPVFQIDENAKTATLLFHQILPTSLYSYFGGNTEQLLNGNIEYDLAGTNITTSDIYEVTPTSTPQTVWHMHTTTNAYRGYRIPSLYPGIQW